MTAKRKRNPPHTDTQEARELYLFAVDDGHLYRSCTTLIIDNLKKKIKKGVYDKVLALKLWRYAADDAAQRYTKEFDTRGSSLYGIFTVPMRNEVATLLQEHYDEELHYAAQPNRQENPETRIGTAHLKRRSQITKRAPSKRLVARRAKDTKRGYFPNPLNVEKLWPWIIKQVHATGTIEIALVRSKGAADEIAACLQLHAKPNTKFMVQHRGE